MPYFPSAGMGFSMKIASLRSAITFEGKMSASIL